MFTNKKDPLVDSVKAVMEENSKRRYAESLVNEAFGVTSRKALPHELHAKYDAALAEAIEDALNEGKDDDKPFHQEGDKIEKLPSKAKGTRRYKITPAKYKDHKFTQPGDKVSDYKETEKNGSISRSWKVKKEKDDPYGPDKEIYKEDLNEGDFKSAIKSLGKKIAVGTYKNDKFRAAQSKPGSGPDQQAKRISHVKSLAKEETQIKESFEKFLRNRFLKD